jgi:hypothetical protein
MGSVYRGGPGAPEMLLGDDFEGTPRAPRILVTIDSLRRRMMSPFEEGSAEPPPRLPGTPVNLSESLQQRFNSSGLAASAAGVGLLALK